MFDLSKKTGTFYPWSVDKSLPYGKRKRVFSGYAEKFFQVSFTFLYRFVSFRIKYSIKLIGPDKSRIEYMKLMEGRKDG